ncbi:MAG TPA: prepilin-type N-terminal cleavage/methylation domain-containing protein [Phycisphaerae bacterium]|nr:prepilin-type N-terminal cleavage/methylation domain-containing protein [Phycisphaerae bacterium]
MSAIVQMHRAGFSEFIFLNDRVNIMTRRAFTLIELLVVIAIIAILLAVLLPSLSAARVAGYRTASARNMEQIGIGLSMYADDNGGYFPETTHGLPFNRSWIFTLMPYVGNVNEIRLCPMDPYRGERLANDSSSFVLNEYISVINVDPFGNVIDDYTNLHRLISPSTTISTFVGADGMAVSVSSDHTHSRQWFADPSSDAWTLIRQDIQPDRYGPGDHAADNTRGSSNYLFADTHVESTAARAIKDKADARINFARPMGR